MKLYQWLIMAPLPQFLLGKQQGSTPARGSGYEIKHIGEAPETLATVSNLIRDPQGGCRLRFGRQSPTSGATITWDFACKFEHR